MKLIKLELTSDYRLDDENGELIASTLEGAKTKLSKQNCDEIFGVTDVEKLACDECHIDISAYKIIQTLESGKSKSELQLESKVDGFILGFNKAVELNKDKLFTVEDVKKAIEIAKNSMGVDNDGEYCYSTIANNEIIQSLQQPKEIEVEIVMRCSLSNGCTEPEVDCTCEPTYNLDENGCLTLWVLSI